MFIHLGGDTVVPKEDVVAILNNQLMKKNEIVRGFLESAEGEGLISFISRKTQAKSVIITSGRIYLSPISSTTLKKRADEPLPAKAGCFNGEPW
jgi:hypothetical protein